MTPPDDQSESPQDSSEHADEPWANDIFAQPGNPMAQEVRRIYRTLEGREQPHEPTSPRDKPERSAPSVDRGRTKPISIRFDEHTIERLKNLAERRDRRYQTMLKEFVLDRLYEEERRDGLIP